MRAPRRAPTSAPDSSWSTLPGDGSGRGSGAAASVPASPCAGVMRTELGQALLLALLLPPCAAGHAQDALTGIGEGTEVAAIEFRFEDRASLSPEELQQRIALTEPGGLAGLRNALDFI